MKKNERIFECAIVIERLNEWVKLFISLLVGINYGSMSLWVRELWCELFHVLPGYNYIT